MISFGQFITEHAGKPDMSSPLHSVLSKHGWTFDRASVIYNIVHQSYKHPEMPGRSIDCFKQGDEWKWDVHQTGPNGFSRHGKDSLDSFLSKEPKLQNESLLMERYVEPLISLRDYLEKEPLYWGSFRPDFVEWVCLSDDRRQRIADLLKMDIEAVNDDDIYDSWADKLEEIPSEWEEPFTGWWKKHKLEYYMRHDPTEVPSWGHMMLSSHKILPRTTWLVHLCDDPEGINKTGFKKGVDDVEKLGLTTYLHQSMKSQGGYNFAFSAASSDLNYAWDHQKYGEHAVMFQSSGVPVYHSGDDEDQIVFWGPSVNPKDIIQIYRDDEGIGVFPSTHSKRKGHAKNDAVFYHEDLDHILDWVTANYRQYSKILTGR